MRLIGILAILIVIVFSTILAGDYVYNNDSDNSKNVNQWQYPEVRETTEEVSFQSVVNMRVDSDKITPREIFADGGDSLVLMIDINAPCTFRLEGLNIVRPLKPGLYELEFMPTETETYRYTCTRAGNPQTREGYLYVR
ncbi:MAG: hypothetical protein ACLFP2_02210 [Candidatus Woesearchaeota archaeon]